MFFTPPACIKFNVLENFIQAFPIWNAVRTELELEREIPLEQLAQ